MSKQTVRQPSKTVHYYPKNHFIPEQMKKSFSDSSLHINYNTRNRPSQAVNLFCFIWTTPTYHQIQKTFFPSSEISAYESNQRKTAEFFYNNLKFPLHTLNLICVYKYKLYIHRINSLSQYLTEHQLS